MLTPPAGADVSKKISSLTYEPREFVHQRQTDHLRSGLIFHFDSPAITVRRARFIFHKRIKIKGGEEENASSNQFRNLPINFATLSTVVGN